VTVSWLTKLEQGRAQSVSKEVLDALADALLLDDTERSHLYALAGLRRERDGGAHRDTVTPALRALLDALEPNPAYILDRAWDVIAFNEAEAALFPALLDYTGEPPNLLELVFCNGDLGKLMVDHDEEAARLVAQLRVHHTEWPGDRGLDDRVSRLVVESELFARLWAANDVAPFESTRREFDHPSAGRLEFDHHRFAILDQPGAQLVVYTPIPGSDSAARLRRGR
jgi:hypothetical protein